MKNFKKFTVAGLVAMSLGSLQAQDENNRWAITVGANAVDFYPTGTIDGNPANAAGTGASAPGNYQSGLFNEFLNAEDHWNIIPAVSRLEVARYIGEGFTGSIAGSLNKIKTLGENLGRPIETSDKKTYIAADAGIGYSFKGLLGSKWLDPNITVGGGYFWLEDANGSLIGTGTANAGLGVKFWLSESVALGLQSTYKHVFEENETTDTEPVTHFQHTAGVTFAFGGKDTDKDGIPDSKDACPTVAGIKEFNGCPDTDNDGVQDTEDACPTVAGLAKLNGCPDSDGDGVIDSKDKCPKIAGLAKLNGCPDKDKDGVTDAKDKCPEVAGPESNKGCPYLDTDGDGIYDNNDQCPNEVGSFSNNGCPLDPKKVEKVIPKTPVVKIIPVTEQEQAQLNAYAKTILFDSGKSRIKTSSYTVLNEIIAILSKHPNSRFMIEGHTDSSGSATFNQRLSESRALSVKNFLASHGVSGYRLTSSGYGESRPVASNATKEGRRQNRRVEINLINNHH